MKNSSAEYKLASLDRLRAVHPLLQSRERGMVAKSTKFVLKTAFGLKCKSPKGKEKKAAEREKRALMWEFGREVSPKDGLVKEGRDIAAEHDFYAQNDKSPGFHIAEAHVRENLCFRLFGGGIVPTTKSDGGFLSSPKDRHVHYTTNPDLAARHHACAYSLCLARISSTGCELRCRTLSAMLPYTSLSNPVLP